MKFHYTLVAIALVCYSTATTQAQSSTEWWNKSVFYELMVRSFYDSDGNGKGDFNGVTAKLDYLNDGDSTTFSDLGVNALWLMPINASPSYHGYDVTDYKSVNSTYGTKAQFKNMVNEAHKRGIKVIIDFVINHTSSSHPWFTKSAANDAHFRNFYRWSTTKPTYKGPFSNTHEVWYAKGTNNYYYALFWSGMPDLNYEYQPVKDSIYSAAKYWLDSMNIDGFRLDAAMYLYESGSNLKNRPETFQFWSDFNAYIKTIKPDAMTIGEVWESNDVIKKYNGKLDNCFQFNLGYAILNALKFGSAVNLGKEAQFSWDSLGNNRYGTFLTNHDQNRVFYELSGDLNKMQAAASVYLTLPGNPFLYYGEEIAMAGNGNDEYKRSPMQWTAGTKAGFTTGSPWQAINSNYATYNVETLGANWGSILNHYKRLIRARTKFKALQTGSFTLLSNNKPSVLSFIRELNGQQVIVLVNTSNDSFSDLTLNLTNTGINDGANTFTNLLDFVGQEISITNATSSAISLGGYEAKLLYLGIATGISQPDFHVELAMYPNPARNELKLRLSTDGLQKLAQIQVFNTIGELKLEKWIVSNTEDTISLAGFSNGVYVVKIPSVGKIYKFVKE